MAYVKTTPARPPVILSRSATANKAVKNTINAPVLFIQNPRHLHVDIYFDNHILYLDRDVDNVYQDDLVFSIQNCFHNKKG